MSRGVLTAKKEREAEQEALFLRALTGRKKMLAAERRANRRRRKSVGDLKAMLSLGGIRERVLRPAETFISHSHNLDRQLNALIRHLFVQYPVPDFMFQACLSGAYAGPLRGVREIEDERRKYRLWFVTLAQGGRFPKMVQGIMTAREACAFLGAPANGTIAANVWWARMQVAGVPENRIGLLNDRIFERYTVSDFGELLREVILFYARYSRELDRASFDEVTDFIVDKLRRDTGFSLKGRTASSVIRLSNEWHREMQYAKLGRHIRWVGLQIPDWSYEGWNEIWEITELHNNKELCSEGRRQKHCVYSYVQRCVDARSAIFSLRAFRKCVSHYDAEGNVVWDHALETRRITVEVSALRRVVQVRGSLNRAPTAEETAVLELWADANQIVLPKKV